MARDEQGEERANEPVTRARVDPRLDQVVREERGRLTGALVRILGDWDLAEELVQDALVAAIEHWPAEGIPRNPGAWLMTTARRRAVDRLRRNVRYRDRLAQLGLEATAMERPIATGGPMAADDRLGLIFTCCHPALSREAQVALTLRTIGGLETPGGGTCLPGARGHDRSAPGSRQAEDPRRRRSRIASRTPQSSRGA